MQTEELITQLSKQVTPVHPLAHPMTQTGFWLLLCATGFGAVAYWSGLRHDLAAVMQIPQFLLELILALITAIGAAITAICLAVPDAYQKLYLRWVPVAGAIALTLLLLYRLGSAEIAFPLRLAPQCAGEMCLYALLPGALLFFLLRRAASTHSGWAGAMCGLAVGLFGYIFLRLTEANDEIPHLLAWHYLPVAAITLVGTLCGNRWLRW